jgi:hypothetical protein
VRQASCLLFLVVFLGVIPLVAIVAIRYGAAAAGVVFGCWLGVLALFAGAMSLVDRRLRREWDAVVARRGWSVSGDRPDLAERWPFPPFDDKTGVRIHDVTEGTHRGRRFWTGRFEFEIGSIRPHFCFVDLEIDRPLPPMWVAPESLIRRLAPALAPIDLHLENREFNERYRMLRGDRALVHAVLNPRAMQAMLSVQPFGWVSEGERFVLLTPGYRRAGTVVAQMDAGCDVLDLIPEHVWGPIGNRPPR